MADVDIGSAVKSDLANEIEDYSVQSKVTDGAIGDIEHEYTNDEWERDLGYYEEIPELKIAIDTKAIWTIGAGFKADEATEMLLDTIRGNGKDSFNSILKNMIKIKTLSKDSFAEIIRDEDGNLINIKPLDPSSIKIIQNNKGQIIRYEQMSKFVKDGIKQTKKIGSYKAEEIFHLSRDRIADSIHGSSLINAVKWIIDARNEAMNDWRKVLQRNVKPIIIWHLDTDDETEIANFKATTDAATAENENLYIPKGTVVPEVVVAGINNATSPLAWIDRLNDYFFQVVNVPQIIIGNAKEFTDASGKIVYLSYEQSVKAEQLYVEEQVLQQLNLQINLTFPASLQTDAISDTTSEVEEEPQEPAAQPNDVNSELEGKQ